MIQKEPRFYSVDPAEVVRMHITPYDVGGLVRAAQNGIAIPNSGSRAAPVFEFPVDPDVQWHFVQIVFGFPAGTPADAQYDLEVCAVDGPCFPDRPVTNRGPVNTPLERVINYEFEVVRVAEGTNEEQGA